MDPTLSVLLALPSPPISSAAPLPPAPTETSPACPAHTDNACSSAWSTRCAPRPPAPSLPAAAMLWLLLCGGGTPWWAAPWGLQETAWGLEPAAAGGMLRLQALECRYRGTAPAEGSRGQPWVSAAPGSAASLEWAGGCQVKGEALQRKKKPTVIKHSLPLFAKPRRTDALTISPQERRGGLKLTAILYSSRAPN